MPARQIDTTALMPASDSKTQACISSTKAKASAAIDKKCAAGGNNPECFGTTFDAGSKWVAPIAALVDGTQANQYCGSASGAFLD